MRQAGVRALLIKGPVLAQFALRAPRICADVDVLVAPTDYEVACATLRQAGWHIRSASFITERTSVHSRTFAHPRWPCDIDVHSSYPGFLADPERVFDHLWASRSVVSLAHIDIDVPSREASAVLLALHSLRGSLRQPRHATELDELRAAPFTPAERDRVRRVIESTHAGREITPILAGSTPPPAGRVQHRSLSERRWAERMQAGSVGAYWWMTALRDARGADRAVVAWRAVWPSRTDLESAHPELRSSGVSRVAERGRRLLRGIRSTPAVVRVILGSGHPPRGRATRETTWS